MASKKSPNFTELEKTVLIELVDSRKGIIESKQNDVWHNWNICGKS